MIIISLKIGLSKIEKSIIFHLSENFFEKKFDLPCKNDIVMTLNRPKIQTNTRETKHLKQQKS